MGLKSKPAYRADNVPFKAKQFMDDIKLQGQIFLVPVLVTKMELPNELNKQ